MISILKLRVVYTTMSVFSLLVLGYQWFIVLPHITFSHPYSDVLHYLSLSENFSFFSKTHFTWRVIYPFFAGLLSYLPFIPIEAAWLFLHLVMVSVLILLLFRESFSENRLTILPLVILCVLLHPTFWRGAFLPMLELPLFVLISILILLQKQRHFILFTLLLFLSVWVKEIVLLLWPAFFLIYDKRSFFRKRVLLQWHLPFLVSALFYSSLVLAYSPPEHTNYIIEPTRWLVDMSHFGSLISLTGVSVFFAALGTPIMLCIYTMWSKKLTTIRCFHFLLFLFFIWLILSLFTLTNSPRLIWPFLGVMWFMNWD